MDTNPVPKNLPHAENDEASYQVMPKLNIEQIMKGQANKTPTPPPPQMPGLESPHAPRKSRKIKYLIAAIVALVVLGALAYFLLGTDKTPENTEAANQLPKTWLIKYFSREVCEDMPVCGGDADPDNDGLSNYDEFKKTRTSLTDSDTDDDGIADGDEANIYRTDPTDKYTDKRQVVAENDFTDGHQIKNGYDPLTPGLKFTETRLEQIAEDTEKFKLHQPTITTLDIFS